MIIRLDWHDQKERVMYPQITADHTKKVRASPDFN